MRMRAAACLLVLLMLSVGAHAGDDASGPISYRVDLSKAFDKHQLTDSDRRLAQRLARKFHYTGKIVHFVKTDLPLEVNGQVVSNQIYQAVEDPNAFYVVKGDSMLQIGYKWAYNPGVGGFSLLRTHSRKLLVCMNCFKGGVPSLSSSPVIKGVVTWTAHDDKRID